MKPSIHLLHPVQSPGKWEKMRCGLTRNKELDKYRTTTNPAEVTCTKCRGFINNPYRSLRSYARVTIIEDFAVMLTHDYGCHYDVNVTRTEPGCWTMMVGRKKKLENLFPISARNMTDLGNQILEIYETHFANNKIK